MSDKEKSGYVELDFGKSAPKKDDWFAIPVIILFFIGLVIGCWQGKKDGIQHESRQQQFNQQRILEQYPDTYHAFLELIKHGGELTEETHKEIRKWHTEHVIKEREQKREEKEDK